MLYVTHHFRRCEFFRFWVAEEVKLRTKFLTSFEKLFSFVQVHFSTGITIFEFCSGKLTSVRLKTCAYIVYCDQDEMKSLFFKEFEEAHNQVYNLVWCGIFQARSKVENNQTSIHTAYFLAS